MSIEYTIREDLPPNASQNIISYSKRAAEVYKSNTPDSMNDDTRVRLHIIEGGAHMFSKKHDVIAMEILKDFAIIMMHSYEK